MKQINYFELQEWDELVEQTYGRTYSFQQQDGCKERGIFKFRLPDEDGPNDYEKDSIPEIVNGDEMGVSFQAWLERDPQQLLTTETNHSLDLQESFLRMWWERHFYPDVSMIIDDMYKKGILPAGDYVISIDW